MNKYITPGNKQLAIYATVREENRTPAMQEYINKTTETAMAVLEELEVKNKQGRLDEKEVFALSIAEDRLHLLARVDQLLGTTVDSNVHEIIKEEFNL